MIEKFSLILTAGEDEHGRNLYLCRVSLSETVNLVTAGAEVTTARIVASLTNSKAAAKGA